MANPNDDDWGALKRIGRYLLTRPRYVQHFKFQNDAANVTAFSDSDFAGCSRTRKKNRTFNQPRNLKRKHSSIFEKRVFARVQMHDQPAAGIKHADIPDFTKQNGTVVGRRRLENDNLFEPPRSFSSGNEPNNEFHWKHAITDHEPT